MRYSPIYNKNDKHPFIAVIFLFALLFLITLQLHFSSDSIRKVIGDIKTEELFIYLFKSENHAFFADEQQNLFSFQKLTDIFFQVATNIKPTDARTFLGNEIPGFVFYDTIVVGTDENIPLSSIPFESLPSPEVLENEKEVAEEKLPGTNEVPQPAPPPTAKTETVFIYHSHNLEAFLPLLKDADSPNKAISSDERVNVVGLGKRLTANLQTKGIGTVHNTTNINAELLKRGLTYSDSYDVSKEIVQEAYANNNQLKYFIDIHRDNLRKDKTTVTINGEDYAKLYFIVGKEHRNYERNLAFTEKLNEELKKRYPGISRGVYIKSYHDGNGVYNQDISDRAILLELGGVDNELEELWKSIDAFSEVFTDIYSEETNRSEQ
ncbi:stage II sporulation protein P [Bacillaceae bacterium Marseille-Q3522]|nr:stage II sporulation protein P [Bacillaceae bacterium Marseille-Q3522]